MYGLKLFDADVALLVFDCQAPVPETISLLKKIPLAMRTRSPIIVGINATSMRITNPDLETFMRANYTDTTIYFVSRDPDSVKRLREAISAAVDWSAVPGTEPLTS